MFIRQILLFDDRACHSRNDFLNEFFFLTYRGNRFLKKNEISPTISSNFWLRLKILVYLMVNIEPAGQMIVRHGKTNFPTLWMW